MVCFPLLPDSETKIENKILIVGGLNIGLLSSKHHIYDSIGKKVNSLENL